MVTKSNSDVFQSIRRVTESGLRLQQEAFRQWSRFWLPGPDSFWGEPAIGLQRRWSDGVSDLVNHQFSLAASTLDVAFGKAATSRAEESPAADNSEKPKASPRPKPAPVSEAHEVPPPSTNIVNKIAVVTGAASGIGEAVVRELAKRGARTVVMVDRSSEVCDVADEINDRLDRKVVLAKVGDTTDDAFRTHVFDDVTAQYGPIRICVPAAGITRDALAVRMDKETGKASVYPVDTFRQVVEVNLIAPIYWAMEMVARIAEDRHRHGLKRWEPTEEIQGAVVFLGSVSSQGNKGQISYAVTKAGLEGAGATLMKEAIFHGVRCGIIHPGFTDTPMARALGQDFLDKYVLPFTQLRRLIRPEEIADAICFMISNSAVSGELWADAGWHPPA